MTLRRRIVTLVLATLTASQIAVRADDEADRFAVLVGLARVKRDAGDPGAARRYFDEARRLQPLRAAELVEYFWIVASVTPADALSVGQDVLKAAPRNADVRDRMIAAAVSVHDESAVVALASTGRQVDPQSARWPRRLGDSYLRQGLYTEAVAAFTAAVLATTDKDVSDRADLAIALEASGQHAQAFSTWTSVPANLVNEHPDWMTSRLHAAAYAAPTPATAAEIEAWLVTHPDDEAMRVALVDLWVLAGRPSRALDALTPLMAGPSADRWLSRQIELARAAGTPERAIAQLTARVNRSRPSPTDQWALADLLVDANDYTRATAVAIAAAPIAKGCDDRLFTLVDRIPGVEGTEAMLKALAVRSCVDRPRWIARGIARAVADKHHVEALSLLRRLPPADAAAPAMRRLEGQLLLWTGHATEAARVLEGVLEQQPGDATARQSLVDAYRTLAKSTAAWAVAAPLLLDRATAVDVRLTLAALALEAQRPIDAAAIVEQLSPADGHYEERTELLGRAQLMQGRATDALRTLSSVYPATLSPEGALALIDGVLATLGPTAAVVTSRPFAATTAPWRDVVARRVLLEAIVGNREASSKLRDSLERLDASAALLSDIEVALAQERPHDALAMLDRLGSTTTTSSARARDLRATALEGVGDYAGASALLAALVIEEPTSASLAIRQALVAWRLRPDAETTKSVLGLPARWPGNQDAAMAVASVHASAGQFEEVLTALGGPAAWHALPAPGRLLAARSLQTLGRPAEALVLVDDLVGLSGSSAILRAQLIASVRGASEAAAAFRTLAATKDATPDLYLAWSAISATEPDRFDVINEAVGRFPTNVALLTVLASAELTRGHSAAAGLAADRAVTVDPRAGAAWFGLVDAAAATHSAAKLESVITKFDRATSGETALRVGMAEHVVAVSRGADAGLTTKALGWLDAVPNDHPLAGTRDFARVRVLAARKQWPDALQRIDELLARDNRSLPALKLRAEVLSWAARPIEAIRAYEAYLALAPADVDARRQQARVATWAGRAGEAEAFYAALEAAMPTNKAVRAEAQAKQAFMAGQWQTAVAQYRAWLAIEPDVTEAQFELAESLRASHHVSEADVTLDRMVAATGHQLASSARTRADILRGPTAGLTADEKNVNGYDAWGLLQLGQRGLWAAKALGDTGAAEVRAEVARLDAEGSVAHLQGYRAGVSLITDVTPSFRLDGQAAGWSFVETTNPMAVWSARATWRATDRWSMNGGASQEPMLENIATIDQRVRATGPFAGVNFETRDASLDLHGSWQTFSDDNIRRRVSITITHTLGEQVRSMRAIVWAEQFGFRSRTPLYFSPSGFLRLDAGLAYVHAFTTPRFRGDRRNELAAGYLVGTDSRGTFYQHPTVRLNLELANGLALDVGGSLIRSATYNESALTVGVRFVGIGSPRTSHTDGR